MKLTYSTKLTALPTEIMGPNAYDEFWIAESMYHVNKKTVVFFDLYEGESHDDV